MTFIGEQEMMRTDSDVRIGCSVVKTYPDHCILNCNEYSVCGCTQSKWCTSTISKETGKRIHAPSHYHIENWGY